MSRFFCTQEDLITFVVDHHQSWLHYGGIPVPGLDNWVHITCMSSKLYDSDSDFCSWWSAMVASDRFSHFFKVDTSEVTCWYAQVTPNKYRYFDHNLHLRDHYRIMICFVPRPQSVWEQDLDCNHLASNKLVRVSSLAVSQERLKW